MVTPRFLLDTSIVSEPLRPKPHPRVLARLKRHREELAIASIVWHELWFGCYRLAASARRDELERYLQLVVAPSIPVLAYDERAAQWHANERARLAAIGKPPPFADGQIAAVAVTNGLTLVTHNKSDYALFADLAVEDWLR